MEPGPTCEEAKLVAPAASGRFLLRREFRQISFKLLAVYVVLFTVIVIVEFGKAFYLFLSFVIALFTVHLLHEVVSWVGVGRAGEINFAEMVGCLLGCALVDGVAIAEQD